MSLKAAQLLSILGGCSQHEQALSRPVWLLSAAVGLYARLTRALQKTRTPNISAKVGMKIRRFGQPKVVEVQNTAISDCCHQGNKTGRNAIVTNASGGCIRTASCNRSRLWNGVKPLFDVLWRGLLGLAVLKSRSIFLRLPSSVPSLSCCSKVR